VVLGFRFRFEVFVEFVVWNPLDLDYNFLYLLSLDHRLFYNLVLETVPKSCPDGPWLPIFDLYLLFNFSFYFLCYFNITPVVRLRL
jgi:hypothetical protein